MPFLCARAAERVPNNVELVIADAVSHPFPEAGYDVVLSNFGLMFFEDNAAAFSNLRKAVRPGGHLAASVWGLPANNPWFFMPRGVLLKFIPDLPKPDPDGPGPMRVANPAPLVAALQSAGWKPNVRSLDTHLAP